MRAAAAEAGAKLAVAVGDEADSEAVAEAVGPSEAEVVGAERSEESGAPDRAFEANAGLVANSGDPDAVDDTLIAMVVNASMDVHGSVDVMAGVGSAIGMDAFGSLDPI